MQESVELWESAITPKPLIAGWRQWADAGAVSSGLPRYLIQQTRARKIGRIRPEGFYLFQLPGAHHLLRPVIRLSEGYRQELSQNRNEFFCSDDNQFLIFLGDEPHQNEEVYADAFFDAVEALSVTRVAAVAGVYGPVPYQKSRDISCVYSLPEMKHELAQYAVKFSDYEGGVTISTYLADRAESRGIEFFALYALVPAYDFSTHSMTVQTVAIEEDYVAWYGLLGRLNRMFDLRLDLADLERRSEELVATWTSKIEYLAKTMPQLGVREYMEQVNTEFLEASSSEERLSRTWEDALGDIFGPEEDSHN